MSGAEEEGAPGTDAVVSRWHYYDGKFKGWTDEAVAFVKDLLRTSHSAQQIANKMGVSRNAIIGVIARRGLNKVNGVRPTPLPQVKMKPRVVNKRTPEARKPTLPAVSPAPPATAEKVAPQALVEAIPAPAKTKAGPLLSLTELHDNHCRWPVGDPGSKGFGFCGAQRVVGSSYCEAHLKEAGWPRRST